MVLINPHSLSLLKSEKGQGKKLLMKYDGPFEIMKKLSPVSYRLRMPASYGIHPVLNIAHLEKYQASPTEFGVRPQKSLNREDFDELLEYEVDKIVAERRKKGQNGKQILQYLTCFKGYSEEFDEWLMESQLKNAPEPLKNWKKTREYSSVGTALGRPNGKSHRHRTPLILKAQSDLEEMVYKTCIFDLTPPDSSPDTTFIQHALSISPPSPRRLFRS